MKSNPSDQNLKKIELSISCRKLKNMDFFSKSDPFVILYIKHLHTKQWVNMGRTETIQDNLNPNFKKTFLVDYIFEVKQECKIEVLDDDGGNSFDFVGEVFTTIGAIVGAKNNIFISEIK